MGNDYKEKIVFGNNYLLKENDSLKKQIGLLNKELEHYKNTVSGYLDSYMNRQRLEFEDRKKIEEERELEKRNREIGQERRRLREEMDKINAGLVDGWKKFAKDDKEKFTTLTGESKFMKQKLGPRLK